MTWQPGFPLAFTAALIAADPYAGQRERMVREQIEARGVRDTRVLQAMRSTPRHLFVPERVRDSAYDDRPLAIGYRATISQPFIVAFMTELLDAGPRHRVLEIGTGSGYQAAILSQIAAKVYTIEIVPELAESARAKLEPYRNIVVRQGDGYAGWREEAPFDRIILTAAPPDIPEALVAQLATGGRLVAPVGPLLDQSLILIEKTRGGIRRSHHGAVAFVPMR